ncbi:phenylacetic acid catabolic [Rhizobium sp. R72]|uniref:Phenylacetic acid catabolic protein n=1 Tax=unclassified Rhizobium TaxID=2613769 RepID=UPI000B52FD49|nr:MULTISPECIES: Phenylacetic acid catabolic protein [unclassified Rhizobium]OWV97419.1 phenylacetic acid catabolic [Rhizobium sp. R72]OWV97758.1 phenylacetic acid catabolic [Rhizobium sp. R711]
MSDTMPIEEYLLKGGVLTSPDNAPPRYRGELLRLMASFVDSELAGAAGFADTINDAPGIKERIASAKIVLEKTDHAGRVLEIMGSFGADTGRYAIHHPWDARLARDADIGAARQGGDMRLSVFHYPLQGWIDAVVMNVLMGTASTFQLRELTHVSYQPLADVFRAILPREAHHTDLGIEALNRIAESENGARAAREAIAYWRPRVAASFGLSASARFETLARFGLRHTPNEALMSEWRAAIDARLAACNLN